jgi:alanine-glyoxylate transaminase/(R)-3-amino-2-methylpropionate-pyruvate transaminase
MCALLSSPRHDCPVPQYHWLTPLTLPRPVPHCPMPAMFALYREPVMITEGKMQYLFDERGRRYLDVRHTGAERFCQLCL